MPSRIPSILIACAVLAPPMFAASGALAIQEPAKVQMKPAAPEGTPGVAPAAAEATEPEALKKQTYSFVDTYGEATPRLDQYARWIDPVCVTVQGLAPDQEAQIKTRIEEVAKGLGVRSAGKGCHANIEVKFSAQPQGFLDQVAATHADLLGYWHRRDRDTLKVMSHPIQAWYRTATIGGGGGSGSAFTFVDGGGSAGGAGIATGAIGDHASGETIDDPDERGSSGSSNGRFSAGQKSVFDHVLIMVDTNAVQASPGLVADYVAMLSMAQPRSLDGCNDLTSVIDLYARGCAGRSPPDGLTRADVAFLTSLYKTDLQAKKASQETDISNRMSDMLLKAATMDRLATWGRAQKTATK